VVVEAIESVRSVDLVAEPATTRSLYEAAIDAVMADQRPVASDGTQADAARKFGIDPDTVLNEKESRFMDLSSLTLAELKEARPDLVEAIQAQTELQKELVALKEERDKFASELEQIKHKEQVAKELKEASLSLDDLPESLRELLETTTDAEKRKKAIGEFKKLLENRKPVSARAGVTPSQELESLVTSWRK
jgi:superfamily II RNA helicase